MYEYLEKGGLNMPRRPLVKPQSRRDLQLFDREAKGIKTVVTKDSQADIFRLHDYPLAKLAVDDELVGEKNLLNQQQG
ncbi:MAG: hypothetical protein A2571_02205 [Candidatus Vogelbacteria bacterium RIFOXYD1_FULL_44_32]|uniref:Uncharacterized protein n=1 Tax=Candidatus Vogelbacteria bacterium RIFOXYD1_FULL_44_32 TaxID=1802438 RepID=A0A1G2QDA8_9BACT|nr:MAG: hypothetical protein A2571_02205 [Candidatus Vogelbacteria bacterium RIFOXYD1_FULL_44_32]